MSMSSSINFLGTQSIPQKQRHGRTSTFNHINGYSVPKTKAPEAVTDDELSDLGLLTLRMTYGDRLGHRQPDTQKMPNYVVLDKKVLMFRGYMKSTVHESALENYRVRLLKVYYYLEDDTISIHEPEVENSGLPQGPFLRRGVLPGPGGDPYHWSDLNVGANIEVYGKVIRLIDCNSTTRQFLTAEGIVVNDDEAAPADPYTSARSAMDRPNYTHATASDFDKFKQFLVLDRKVLRFYCTWDDPSGSGERLKAILLYYLVDDTIEIREEHKVNDGRDPFPVFLSRSKVPRDPRNIPIDFPSSTLEISDVELSDFLNPADFRTGKDVTVYGRTFFLHDCDAFTRDFYKNNFDADLRPVTVSEPRPATPDFEVPPYNGIGSPEDSYLSCVSINPQAPLGQKSLLQLMKHDNKLLRFEGVMDTDDELLARRRFIVSYRLADDMVSVYEPFGDAADGGFGGAYLSYQLLPRRDCDPDRPEYLKPSDLYIGARINVYGVDFVLVDADEAVLKFMEDHPEEFSNEGLNATKEHFENKSLAN